MSAVVNHKDLLLQATDPRIIPMSLPSTTLIGGVLASIIATATEYTASLTDDGKISATEKQQLRSDWDSLIVEGSSLLLQAAEFGIITEATNYIASFEAMATYLNHGVSWEVSDFPLIPEFINDDNILTETILGLGEELDQFRLLLIQTQTDRRILKEAIAAANSLVYTDTLGFRQAGGATNDPVPTGISVVTNSNGSKDVTLTWDPYVQGAIPADQLVIYAYTQPKTVGVIGINPLIPTQIAINEPDQYLRVHKQALPSSYYPMVLSDDGLGIIRCTSASFASPNQVYYATRASITEDFGAFTQLMGVSTASYAHNAPVAVSLDNSTIITGSSNDTGAAIDAGAFTVFRQQGDLSYLKTQLVVLAEGTNRSNGRLVASKNAKFIAFSRYYSQGASYTSGTYGFAIYEDIAGTFTRITPDLITYPGALRTFAFAISDDGKLIRVGTRNDDTSAWDYGGWMQLNDVSGLYEAVVVDPDSINYLERQTDTVTRPINMSTNIAGVVSTAYFTTDATSAGELTPLSTPWFISLDASRVSIIDSSTNVNVLYTYERF